MRELNSKPIVYILIEDETALFRVDGRYVYEIALDQARQSSYKPIVRVFVPRQIYDLNTSHFTKNYEYIVSKSFRDYLRDYKPEGQVMVIHNASRPLVPKKIYDQGIEMLLQGNDAVKQQHVVVDTLKALDDEGIVLSTVDRDQIKALTTPEFYWIESIVGISNEFGWFYEIKEANKKEFIFGELESTRIRSEKDLMLVNALIQQNRLI
jgi:hypothetical protein